MPGSDIPGHPDHGHGPLALIAESFMAPDTWISMHEHVQDEIISYVPHGVMRHSDRATGKPITDPDHLMVMNAGRSF
jgi:redox-sensitive bicupin YhaK (pirin superfamily)